jgi:hypothetical protein
MRPLLRCLTVTGFLACTLSPNAGADGLPDGEHRFLLDLYDQAAGDRWSNTLRGDHPWSPRDTNAAECDC